MSNNKCPVRPERKPGSEKRKELWSESMFLKIVKIVKSLDKLATKCFEVH